MISAIPPMNNMTRRRRPQGDAIDEQHRQRRTTISSVGQTFMANSLRSRSDQTYAEMTG